MIRCFPYLLFKKINYRGILWPWVCYCRIFFGGETLGGQGFTYTGFKMICLKINGSIIEGLQLPVLLISHYGQGMYGGRNVF